MERKIKSVCELRENLKKIRQRPISVENILEINRIFEQDEKRAREQKREKQKERKIAKVQEVDI